MDAIINGQPSPGEKVHAILICPQAHYAGHYWRDASALASALEIAGIQSDSVVAAPPLGGGRVPGPIWRSLPMWWARLSKWYIKSKGCRWQALLNNIETLACALRAWVLLMRRSDAVLHFLGGTHIVILLLTLACRRPVFMSIYGELYGRSGKRSLKTRIRDALFNRALATGRFAVICETESLRTRWSDLLGNHIHTIPYAIEVTPRTESRDEARRALGLPEDQPILLLFGTQRQGKNYRTVFEAVQNIDAAVHLYFVGKIISDNDPRKLATEFGNNGVSFVDRFVDDAEIPRFFWAADVVLLPYEAGFDRGSGVLLDAARFGLPVIVSRTGYLEWFIETYKTGILYRADDAADLGNAINSFLGLGDSDRSALKSAISQTAKLHSWPCVIQDYARLYNEYSRRCSPY